MEKNSLEINGGRLHSWIDELSKIGLDPSRGEGLFRNALTSNDKAGRAWFVDKLREHDLDVFVDGAMNIHGRLNWPKE